MNIEMQLWEMLAKRDLVTGERPEGEELESPWFIKVLSAISGWLASIFLFGFLGFGMVELVKSEVASFIVGVGLIGVAFSILKLPKSEFTEHMALAMSLAGQVFVIVTLGKWFDFETITFLFVVFVFQLSLAFLIQNQIHRLFCSMFSSLVLFWFLARLHLNFLFPGLIMLFASYVFINQWKLARTMNPLRPIVWGMLTGLFLLKFIAVFNHKTIEQMLVKQDINLNGLEWVSQFLLALVIFYSIYCLLERYGYRLLSLVGVGAICAVAFLGMLSIKADGIAIAVLIIIFGFANANKVLFGFGIISLLSFMSVYYYQLNETLLYKSILLAVCGLLMLTVYGVLNYFSHSSLYEKQGEEDA